jgi:hypothetical protein
MEDDPGRTICHFYGGILDGADLPVVDGAQGYTWPILVPEEGWRQHVYQRDPQNPGRFLFTERWRAN